MHTYVLRNAYTILNNLVYLFKIIKYHNMFLNMYTFV